MLEKLTIDCCNHLFALLDAIQSDIARMVRMQMTCPARILFPSLASLRNKQENLLCCLNNLITADFTPTAVLEEPPAVVRVRKNKPAVKLEPKQRTNHSRIYKTHKHRRVINKVEFAEAVNFHNDGLIVSDDNRQISYL